MDSIITPLERLTPLNRIESMFSTQSADETEDRGLFKTLFESAVNNVIETDNASTDDSESLAVGDVDDLHTLSINNYKSYLAVDLLVQMRNKALDAYSQIMQISV